MTKRILFIGLACLIWHFSALADPKDSTENSIKDVNPRTFKLESNLIADQLDSLMMLHVFNYTQDLLPVDYDSTLVPTFADSIYKKRLAALDAITPLELEFNPIVKRYIELYTLKRREQVGRMLGLANYYFPMFEEILDRYNMPLELKYLAVVESALNPKAKSRVGATGLWQFMYGTGKLMGLQVNSYVDERNDPIKSTIAACEYMTKLYKMFGDWNLVLAAYNSGPGNVNKAIRRSGGKKSYWELRPFLPRETAGYVPAFIAATYTMSYAAEHNLYATIEIPHFGETDTILVKDQISFDQLNKWIGIAKDELDFLNPSYRYEIIPVVADQNHFLILPNEYMGAFIQNEDSIYSFAGREFAENRSEMPKLTNEDRITHKVKSGENLGLIAKKYGTSVSKIKRWNGLKSDMIRPGQRLTIYRSGYQASSKPKEETKSMATSHANGKEYYTVQSGDTLYDIAKRFPGVSSTNLAEWNNIDGNSIKPGMKLVVGHSSSSSE